MAAPETISEPVRYPGPAWRRGGAKAKNLRMTGPIQFVPNTGETLEGAISTTDAKVSRLIHVVSTPSTVDRMLYIDVTHSSGKEAAYIISTNTATSGDNTALRARGESDAATKSSGETRGVHAQGIANASKVAVTVNALYAEAIAKGTSTVTTLRGAFIAADSEGTPTAITNMTGCHIRVKTSKAVTTDFNGLIVETEKFGSGVACDNLILVKDTTWAGGSTISTDGLAFETTGDITNLIYNASNCTNFIKWSATSGKGVSTGSLKDSAGADIKCDFYVTCDIAGTAYYLALYDTLN
jgi:hypothetical protein